jgi:hypothetical protein
METVIAPVTSTAVDVATEIKHKNMLDLNELAKVAVYLLSNKYNSETEIEGIKVTANNVRTAKILSNAISENLSKIDATVFAKCLTSEQIDNFVNKLNDAKSSKIKEEEVILLLKDRGFDDAKIQKFLKS